MLHVSGAIFEAAGLGSHQTASTANLTACIFYTVDYT